MQPSALRLTNLADAPSITEKTRGSPRAATVEKITMPRGGVMYRPIVQVNGERADAGSFMSEE